VLAVDSGSLSSGCGASSPTCPRAAAAAGKDRARSERTDQERTNRDEDQPTTGSGDLGDAMRMRWSKFFRPGPLAWKWNGTIRWIDDTFIICLCRFAFATARNQNVMFLTSQQVHPNVLEFWHVRDQRDEQ
jgi:hypothetical protein